MSQYIKFEGDIILSKNHPFVKNFDVLVGKRCNSWECLWRDFSTTKQEAWFETKTQALQFAAGLRARCRIISDRYIVGDMETLDKYHE